MTFISNLNKLWNNLNSDKLTMKSFYIWDGVYNNFSELPATGSGFESDKWVESNFKKTKEIMDSYIASQNSDVRKYGEFKATHLQSQIAHCYSQNNSCRVLDFGGGMGTTFIESLYSLPECENLSFDIVEGEQNCIKGREIFKDDKRVSFIERLPAKKKFDIIHISSSLQYIEDWKSLLHEMCERYDAEYFVFNDLPANNIKNTYATIQNYYDSKISYWFFKLEDIVNFVESENYKLIFQSDFYGTYLGIPGPVPQENFPDEYQIKHSKNLIFKKA